MSLAINCKRWYENGRISVVIVGNGLDISSCLALDSCSISFSLNSFLTYTAKTKCLKFETNIPRKGISGPQPQFHIHVSVNELYIPTMGLPYLLEEICGPILGIYKSLTDT